MFCNITVTKLNMYIYPRASDLGVSGNSLLYLHCDIIFVSDVEYLSGRHCSVSNSAFCICN